MKKKVMQIMAVCCLLFCGLLGMDLGFESEQDLILQNVMNKAQARGCGEDSFNHHRPLGAFTICFDVMGRPVGVGTGHTCIVADQKCCKFPTENTCQSLAL
ncbi:hypothetical protein [Algoriphagus namhaensis]